MSSVSWATSAERLTALLGGVAWPVAYVALLVLYVLMHYMFVSQSAQVLALFGVFLDVAVRTGVPASLMTFALLFASSYFSTITPQGWQPEHHFRRQQLPDPGRALPAWPADHGVLPTRVPGAGNALVAFRRKVKTGNASMGNSQGVFDLAGGSTITSFVAKCFMSLRSSTENESGGMLLPSSLTSFPLDGERPG